MCFVFVRASSSGTECTPTPALHTSIWVNSASTETLTRSVRASKFRCV